MENIRRFIQMDIVKEIIWTLLFFIGILAWSLAMMLCIDFMFFAYNSIEFWQFALAALVIAVIFTANHIRTTVKKYKKGDASVL